VWADSPIEAQNEAEALNTLENRIALQDAGYKALAAVATDHPDITATQVLPPKRSNKEVEA
jgi:hypothetical protein